MALLLMRFACSCGMTHKSLPSCTISSKGSRPAISLQVTDSARWKRSSRKTCKWSWISTFSHCVSARPWSTGQWFSLRKDASSPSTPPSGSRLVNFPSNLSASST